MCLVLTDKIKHHHRPTTAPPWAWKGLARAPRPLPRPQSSNNTLPRPWRPPCYHPTLPNHPQTTIIVVIAVDQTWPGCLEHHQDRENFISKLAGTMFRVYQIATKNYAIITNSLHQSECSTNKLI
jgi:hypothetical protein